MKHWVFLNFDFDDYYWMPTDPPYTTKHNPMKRKELLLKDIGDNKSYIISGHYGDYMQDIDDTLTMAVFIYTPMELRKKRLTEREMADFGDRAKLGGDMHESIMKFIDWSTHYDASDLDGRNLQKHVERMLSLTCLY